jgi:predicted phage-related endonuclease
MIVVNCEQGSEAWFENRLGRITGTRFKDLMSGESTKGFKDLIATLTGEILSNQVEETYSNAVMERGKDLEPIARKEYESIFDVQVKEFGFIIPDEDKFYHEYVGYSPDGERLEIKCPLIKAHLNYIERGVLPNEYKWQVQGGLFVTGWEYIDFMSYYPNLKPFIIRVEPDEQMHQQITERLKTAIEMVKKRIELYNLYDYLV